MWFRKAPEADKTLSQKRDVRYGLAPIVRTAIDDEEGFRGLTNEEKEMRLDAVMAAGEVNWDAKSEGSGDEVVMADPAGLSGDDAVAIRISISRHSCYDIFGVSKYSTGYRRKAPINNADQ